MIKTLLVVLDGFGINRETLDENSIHKAKTPVFDKLFSGLTTELEASGLAVGIPEGQMGNSEVGHLTIGSGKILKQSLVKINELFKEKKFEHIESFKKGISRCLENNSTLHIFTLFGNGGVHASGNHLEEILKIIPSDIKVSLHLFGDGRDLEPQSMLGLLQDFEKNVLSINKNVTISSISGRYFAMDRDNNWERVKKAYDTIFFGNNKTELSSQDFIKSQYENKTYDEFLPPTFFQNGIEVQNNDTIFFLNYRSDRAKQLTKAIVSKEFNEFETKSLENIYFVGMTKYSKELSNDIFVEDDKIDNVLGKVFENNNLKQLHIAETEKFAHVTKFFNGGVQDPFVGEKDILIPSHKVATYDLDPEMSALEIYDTFEKNALNYDFIVINYANGDMVGHTGHMHASEKAVEELDKIIGKTIEFCKNNDIKLFITADHGNCEEMGDENAPKTSHTTNKVPFWFIDNSEIVKTKKYGGLANVASTILNVMGIEAPTGMEKSLI